MPSPFCFDREFALAARPGELWSILLQTDDYTRWWPWLRVCDAAGLEAGTRTRCEIRAPLAYQLHCTVTVDRVAPPAADGHARLDATVGGDLCGPARLEIRPSPGACRARLTWTLELRSPILARMARVARPAMAWAHDAVVAAGLEQFRSRALSEHAPRSTSAPELPKHQTCPGG